MLENFCLTFSSTEVYFVLITANSTERVQKATDVDMFSSCRYFRKKNKDCLSK